MSTYWKRVEKLIDGALYDLECRSAAEPSEMSTLKGLEVITNILKKLPSEVPLEIPEEKKALTEEQLLEMLGDGTKPSS